MTSAHTEKEEKMEKQLTLFEISKHDNKEKNAKRRWENAFQKWSDDYGIGDKHSYESYGCCGFGSMCGYCDDNAYGRPCVRALNAMCRDKGISIDYSDYDFAKIW